MTVRNGPTWDVVWTTHVQPNRWPNGTAELNLYELGKKPANRRLLFFNWGAVAPLDQS
jgi:hypothetical protein